MKTTRYRGTDEEARALSAYVKLMRAAETLSERIHRPLRDEGLTVSQFGVLEALYHLGPLSQGEVAAKVLRTSGNLTLVVDNLIKRGLLNRERNENDRRFYRLSLTPEGRTLMSGLFPRHARAIVDEMAVLDPEEQHELGRLCRLLGLGATAKEDS